MAFRYSCFISYRDYRTDINSRLITDLHKAVSDELCFHVDAPVFLDTDRLGPGYFYNEVLATALCESLCMILVYTPRYFDSSKTYCAREYRAMVDLEDKRLSSLKNPDLKSKGLILPIVIRGEANLPAEIKDRRKYWNFGKIHLGEPEMRSHPSYASKISEIAEYIGTLYKAFASLSDVHSGCDKYKLPPDSDIKEWLAQITAPSTDFPLR